VVIIGAGFGGLLCAKQLEGSQVDVLLLDKHNYHLFTPLLYQVASSLLNASDIAFPVRRVFRGSTNVVFRQAVVDRIDFETKEVILDDGEAIPYDYVVVAAGSVTHFFGNEAIERRSLGLKTLSEALQLRNHVLACLEAAALEPNPEVQRALMTFVIVGGGPTGVEYAGALAELMRLVLSKEYSTIKVPARILLLEGQKQLLGVYSKRLGDYTKERLEHLGVEVRLETLLKSADEEKMVLSDRSVLFSRTLVWSAGVRPAAVVANLGVKLAERSRRILVDDYLRIVGQRDAFAIGDVAGFKEGDKELPMLSAPAMQEGRYVGDFILAHLADKPGDPLKRAPFWYLDKGTMATIGRNAAVCDIRGFQFTGFIAWLAWLAIHIYYLIGYRNRLVVLWGWCWNYLWYDRPVRILAEPKGPPKLARLAAPASAASGPATKSA
jgi:NADH dehydrogenase